MISNILPVLLSVCVRLVSFTSSSTTSIVINRSWIRWNVLFFILFPIIVTGFSASSVNGMNGGNNDITGMSSIGGGSSTGSSSSSTTMNSNTINVMPPISSTTTTTSTTMNNKYQNKINDINEYIPVAQKALHYFDKSTDPFHAVQTSINTLKEYGFIEINNADNNVISNPNTIKKSGKYYYTKNKSTLVAFTIGEHVDFISHTSKSGFVVIGGHTDSPNLRIKPRSKRSSSSGSIGNCIQLGVECYGGGLWHTWFDRDLGISGRVFVRTTSTSDVGTIVSKIQQKLINVNRPILRISNLAIHLQTQDERKGFVINNEDHLSPILSMEVKKALTGGTTSTSSMTQDNDSSDNENGWNEYQEPALLYLLANELHCTTNDIIDFELNLYDIQKSVLGGAFSEFIYSSRLDNLASCYMAVEALCSSSVSDNDSSNDNTDIDTLLSKQTDVNMIVLYDHEEVGSTSAVGAASPILEEAIEGITLALTSSSSLEQQDSNSSNQQATTAATLARIKRNSFVISSDQAHAIHPNYSNKHEKNHQPKMNNGMVIKRNSNQRYATNSIGGIIIREIVRMATTSTTSATTPTIIPVPQEFIVRQDCGCGSTIGPTISARTGIRTIDMGCPQLSMHSIREIMGTKDLLHGINLFKAYFQYFRIVDNIIEQ